MPQVNEFSWFKSFFLLFFFLCLCWLKFSATFSHASSLTSFKLNKFNFFLLV